MKWCGSRVNEIGEADGAEASRDPVLLALRKP
jgi:hypothetical protein